jgi:hypothetical protein
VLDAGLYTSADAAGPSADGDAGPLDAGVGLSSDAAVTVDSGTRDDGGVIVVGVGYATRRVWTTDGLHWNEAPVFTDKPPEWTNEPALPVDGDNAWLVRHTCFGAGRFLAVGVGLLLESTDGRSWRRPSGSSGKSACAFGNERFTSGFETSVDGLEWNDAVMPPLELRSLVFSDGRFVTAGDQNPGGIFVSSDGSRFTRLAPASSSGIYNQVIAGGGQIVAWRSNVEDGALFESNGTTSTERARLTALGVRGEIVAGLFANGQFWLFGWDDVFTRAPGATAWTRRARTGPAQPGRQVVHAFGRFVSTHSWSPDGLEWRPSTRPVADGPGIEALAVGAW